MNKKKGSVAVVFIALLVGLFILTLFFTIFSEPINIAYNNTYGLLTNGTSRRTYDLMMSIYDFWPVAAFLGFLVAGLVIAQRSSEREAY